MTPERGSNRGSSHGSLKRQQLRIGGGRRIDFVDLGDPAGVPALYLHGTPSSAGEARWLHGAACVQGVRLVSPDRPGYLQSERSPVASFVAVAEDVVAVADALALARFAVVAFSGGAGYALATASLAPERVTVVHIGGGIGSLAGVAGKDLPLPRRLMFKLVAGVPAVFGPVLAGGFRLLRRGIAKRLDAPAEAATWFFKGPAQGAQIAAVAEYIRITAPDDLRDELSDFAEGTRATRAIVDDLKAYVRPWPFDLSTLTTRVELWHGRNDPAAPIAFAERMASDLPNAELHAFTDEGHFVFHAHAEAVTTAIREHAAN